LCLVISTYIHMSRHSTCAPRKESARAREREGEHEREENGVGEVASIRRLTSEALREGLDEESHVIFVD